MRGTSTLLDKWDQRWLDIAGQVSSWSKDPSTKIGAIAVKDKRLVATGYNGFPRGIEDTEDRWNNREEKYMYVIHAEMNCIYNANYHHQSLKGATMYIVGLPVCHECAKGIIQAGVSRVVATFAPLDSVPMKWLESNAITEKMFKEAGVIYDKV
jgi:dCMP deaminase|tara:strand:+ start:47 stop:508 length:462 start_codon:yes stop_codon:yes gene_type:complete